MQFCHINQSQILVLLTHALLTTAQKQGKHVACLIHSFHAPEFNFYLALENEWFLPPQSSLIGLVLKEWHSMEDSYSIFNFSQIYSGYVFSSFIWEIISSTYQLSGLLMPAIKNRSHRERKIVVLSLVLFIWSCYTQLITWKLAVGCMPFAPGAVPLLIWCT